MALSGHANRTDECPLWGESGHDADVTQCLLMTQSGQIRRLEFLRPSHRDPQTGGAT